MKVIWSDEALNDLETIYDYLAEKSQPSAEQIIEAILGRSRQLESFPESGARLEAVRANTKTYRHLVEGNYKIIYSFLNESQTVHIASVFDTRYDPEKLNL